MDAGVTAGHRVPAAGHPRLTKRRLNRVSRVMANPLRPWRRPGRLFRSAAHVAVGLPVAIFTFVVTVVMAILSICMLPVFLLGVPIGWLTLMVSRGLADVSRSRAGHLRNTDPRLGAATHPPVVARPARRAAEVRRPVAGDRGSPPRPSRVCHQLCGDGCSVVRVDGDGAVAGLRRHASRRQREVLLLRDLIDGPGTMAGVHRGTRRTRVRGTVDHDRRGGDAVGALADRLLGPTDDERLAAEVTELQSSRTAAVDSRKPSDGVSSVTSTTA